MQLTFHAEYALRVLLYLGSRPRETVATKEISSAFGVSKNHLVRVIQTLGRCPIPWRGSRPGTEKGRFYAPHLAMRTRNRASGHPSFYSSHEDIFERCTRSIRNRARSAPVHLTLKHHRAFVFPSVPEVVRTSIVTGNFSKAFVEF